MKEFGVDRLHVIPSFFLPQFYFATLHVAFCCVMATIKFLYVSLFERCQGLSPQAPMLPLLVQKPVSKAGEVAHKCAFRKSELPREPWLKRLCAEHSWEWNEPNDTFTFRKIAKPRTRRASRCSRANPARKTSRPEQRKAKTTASSQAPFLKQCLQRRLAHCRVL